MKMSELISELPSFEEIYGQYEGRRSDVSEPDVPIEDVGISNREEVQSAMDNFAASLFEKYRETSENDPNASTRRFDEEQLTKTNVHLGEVVLDESIPLTMDVYKNFTNERGVRTESINFYLYRGSGDSSENVGNISIADHGDGRLDVIDRFVDPKFRKQGIGKMLFKCADTYLQKVSNGRQKPIEAFAKMSQLPVIDRFWKEGYRPETHEDWRRLDMIINGDDSLELAERYFVFEKSTPDDDRYFKLPSGEFAINGQGRRVINYNNAFRIRMVKKFEAVEDEDVDELRGEVKDDIRKI